MKAFEQPNHMVGNKEKSIKKIGTTSKAKIYDKSISMQQQNVPAFVTDYPDFSNCKKPILDSLQRIICVNHCQLMTIWKDIRDGVHEKMNNRCNTYSTVFLSINSYVLH